MRWVKKLPTKEGWYWWQKGRDKKIVWVERFEGDTVMRLRPCWIAEIDGDSICVSKLRGQWSGPLTPPDDQAKEEG